MAGSSLYQDESANAISDINVTPLVDVTLVLLIIFMVTAKLIVSRGINVQTPKLASGEEVKSTLQLIVDRDSKLYVNGTPYPDYASMRARVAELARENPQVKAILTADASVPYGVVARVMDEAKLAGVSNFGLSGDPRTPDDDMDLDEPSGKTPGAP